eukprot:509911-Amphidinium_carterae.1
MQFVVVPKGLAAINEMWGRTCCQIAWNRKQLIYSHYGDLGWWHVTSCLFGKVPSGHCGPGSKGDA